MFLLCANTSKHGGKRKRYKNFEALIFAFAEAAKIIGIKNSNNGCVIYECRNNPVRIMISKMP
jgi:hypothetical protein